MCFVSIPVCACILFTTYLLNTNILLLITQVSVRTTIGFAKEAPVLGIFGINVYHKNRLIMVYYFIEITSFHFFSQAMYTFADLNLF